MHRFLLAIGLITIALSKTSSAGPKDPAEQQALITSLEIAKHIIEAYPPSQYTLVTVGPGADLIATSISQAVGIGGSRKTTYLFQRPLIHLKQILNLPLPTGEPTRARNIFSYLFPTQGVIGSKDIVYIIVDNTFSDWQGIQQRILEAKATMGVKGQLSGFFVTPQGFPWPEHLKEQRHREGFDFKTYPATEYTRLISSWVSELEAVHTTNERNRYETETSPNSTGLSANNLLSKGAFQVSTPRLLLRSGLRKNPQHPQLVKAFYSYNTPEISCRLLGLRRQ